MGHFDFRKKMKLLVLLVAIAAAGRYVPGTLPVIPGNFTATVKGVGLTPFPAGTLKVNRGAFAYNTTSAPNASFVLFEGDFGIYVNGAGPYDGPNATTSTWIEKDGQCTKQPDSNPGYVAQMTMSVLSFSWLSQAVQIGTMTNLPSGSIWNPTSGPANCTLFRSTPLPYQGTPSPAGAGLALTASFCPTRDSFAGALVQNTFGLGWLQGYVVQYTVENTPYVKIYKPASCDNAQEGRHSTDELVKKHLASMPVV